MGLPSGAGALVGQRLGKYEILALLALGGTAEIYLARIDGTGGFEKYVVVKCLHDHLAEDAEFVSMFLDEARLGAALDHSNIVQTLGLGEHEGRYYIVMEFIAGLSLALVGRRAHERVRGGRVPVPIILNVTAQACEGLHYAHERTEGLVHRDVSPQNLVITYEGIVKVVDFGIAKAQYRETRTRTGTVKGKFAYMSPEQCQAGDVDRRTDVFALGVIVWELLTGRRLFKRDQTYETYQAVIACQVPPPSSLNHELDPAVDELVMRALQKDRTRRYPTAQAFGEAMIGYLHHRGKPSGAGEIARFFEECFAQEIDEHGARMRELIEGRRKSIADHRMMQWDSSELDGSASMLAPEDFELLEGSSSEPAAAPPAAGASVGPMSPGLARTPTTAERAAARPGASQPPPVPPETITDADPIPPEDDFEARQTTDIDAWSNEPGGVHEAETRIDGPQLARRAPTTGERAAARASTTGERNLALGSQERALALGSQERALALGSQERAAAKAPSGERPAARAPTTGERRQQPEPPPRKGAVTPPGMRAGGAPLDPLPHERALQEQVAGAAAPKFPTNAPTVVAGTAAPKFAANAPTVIAGVGDGANAAGGGANAVGGGARGGANAVGGDVGTSSPQPASRFADAPTVHEPRVRPPTPAAELPPPPATHLPPAKFADAQTLIAVDAAAARPATPVPQLDPQTGQTQMLTSEDLVEVAPSGTYAPAAPAIGTPAGVAVAGPSDRTEPDLPPPQLPPGYGGGALDVVSMPSPEAAFPDNPYYQHVASGGEIRKVPPWALGVMFVIVLALATGITVALARALA